jgi:hypothetical protein
MKNRFSLLIALLAIVAMVFPTSAFAANAANPWHFDAEFGGFVIDEPQDGSMDVGISEDLAQADPVLGAILMNVRNGVPAKWTMTVDSEIIMCVGEVYLDGKLIASKTNCDGKNVKVGSGEIVIKNSTGPTGGFRDTVTSGGWHVENPGTSCPPLDGICWDKTDGLDWTGAADGSADIHQASDYEALQAVREGAVVEIDYSVPGQIVGTCHILIEKLEDGKVMASFERHDCGQIDTAIKFPAGTYRFSNSTSEQGGWRLTPWFGSGWRADQKVPANYSFVELVPGSVSSPSLDSAPAGSEDSESDEVVPPSDSVKAELVKVEGSKITFNVTADGVYKLNQEGNLASEQLSATATNGSVTFVMKSGNKSFQLANVPVTSKVNGWSVCPNATDWICKDSNSANPASNGSAGAPEEPSSETDKPNVWQRIIAFWYGDSIPDTTGALQSRAPRWGFWSTLFVLGILGFGAYLLWLGIKWIWNKIFHRPAAGTATAHGNATPAPANQHGAAAATHTPATAAAHAPAAQPQQPAHTPTAQPTPAVQPQATPAPAQQGAQQANLQGTAVQNRGGAQQPARGGRRGQNRGGGQRNQRGAQPAQPRNQQAAAAPTLTSVSSLSPGTRAKTVTLVGTNFTQRSNAKVNGNNISATYVSPTKLEVKIPANMRTRGNTIQIKVVDPNGSSSVKNITVR